MGKYHYDKTIKLVNSGEENLTIFNDTSELKKQFKQNIHKNIKAPKGRCVICVDMDYKNSHKLENGTNIRLERDVENLNKRYTAPVNATIVYAEDIPIGAEVIINHNSTHDTNRIFELEELDGETIASEIRYFSIPENDCYIYKEENAEEWKPCKNFVLGLRVFEPYNGILEGVKPKEIKNHIYITSDCKLKGMVVKTVHAALYEMIFQGKDGREQKVIRIRHSQDPNFDREEIELIDYEKTKKVKQGELLIGLNVNETQKYDN